MTWYVGLEGFVGGDGVWCRRVELMFVYAHHLHTTHIHTHPPHLYTLVWEGGGVA